MLQLLVTAVIGIIVAGLNEAISTGLLLGQYRLPASWSPWASLVVAFLGGFAAALKANEGYGYAAIQGLLAIATVFGAGAAIRSKHFMYRKKIGIKGVPGKIVNDGTDSSKAS